MPELANSEKSLCSSSKMKWFLITFIDHCFKDLDYTVKEKIFIEKLCDIEIKKSDDLTTFYTGTFKLNFQ